MLTQEAADDLRMDKESARDIVAERTTCFKGQAEREKIASQAEAEKATTQLTTRNKLIETARETQGLSMRKLSAQNDERPKRQTEEHSKSVNSLVWTRNGVVQQLTEVVAKNATLEALSRCH